MLNFANSVLSESYNKVFDQTQRNLFNSLIVIQLIITVMIV